MYDPGVTKQKTNRYAISLLTFSISAEMERNNIKKLRLNRKPEIPRKKTIYWKPRENKTLMNQNTQVLKTQQKNENKHG